MTMLKNSLIWLNNFQPINSIMIPCLILIDSLTVSVTISALLFWLLAHKTWTLRAPLHCCRRRRPIKVPGRSTSTRKAPCSLITRPSRARFLRLLRLICLPAINTMPAGRLRRSVLRPRLQQLTSWRHFVRTARPVVCVSAAGRSGLRAIIAPWNLRSMRFRKSGPCVHKHLKILIKLMLPLPSLLIKSSCSCCCHMLLCLGRPLRV